MGQNFLNAKPGKVAMTIKVHVYIVWHKKNRPLVMLNEQGVPYFTKW